MDEQLDEYGRTPLMLACMRGDIQVARELVRMGANVNATNKNGTTPLMYAKTSTFKDGDTKIMELLLNAGADAAMRDIRGKSAADYTVERSELILRLLKGIK